MENNVGYKLPVPVRKTVQMKIFVLNFTVGGQPVATIDSINKNYKIACERYAQVGVKILPPVIVSVDPPAGVDIKQPIKIVDGPNATKQTPGAALQAIFNLYGTSSPDDLEVYYIYSMYEIVVDPVTGNLSFGFPRGHTFAEYNLDSASLAFQNKCVIADVGYPFTLAHEIGHALRNDDHDAGEIKLMRDGTSSSNNLGASKRLDDQDEQRILQSNLVH